eukprot:14496062-Ditylum_brightwellii.AAC.1
MKSTQCIKDHLHKEESVVHTAEDIDSQEARGTIPESNDYDEDGQDCVAAPNPENSQLTQEDLEQRDNENKNAIAKKDSSVLHTAEDIGGQEARGTIHEPNDHDEDGQ